MNDRRDYLIFATIIAAQFCGTSLWFATNAVLPQFQLSYHWPATSLGYLTASVQLGFIVGTLLFAIRGIADRHSPSMVFLVCSLAGAASNVLVLLAPASLALAVVSRLATGFFLAGVYPVGMKLAADYRQQGLGNWLGALVGALVLGTAFPHALRLFPGFGSTASLIAGVSAIASIGGVAVYLIVPDGPFRSKGTSFNFSGIKEAFKSAGFRGAAFGYFGHMWELYTLWAFIPIILSRNAALHNGENSPLLSFIIIASGAAGCILGGLLSGKIGSRSVAFVALTISGICCLLSPLLFTANSEILFVTFMVIWGTTVVADSPQFSTLVARFSPVHVKGSAITIVTSIGFAITILSIQLTVYLQDLMGDYLAYLLIPGPIFGLLMMIRNK